MFHVEKERSQLRTLSFTTTLPSFEPRITFTNDVSASATPNNLTIFAAIF